MSTIYQYLDYQQFLREYYEEKKKTSPFFTYRYMGNKLGLDPGFLVKVFQGKMHLSLKSLPPFTSVLKLEEREAEYFELLVRYGRATSAREIKIYFEKLLKFRNTDPGIIDATQYEFYQKWYYSAIRELIGFFDFKGDYRTLASKLSPAISAMEAKKAIGLLDRLGLIKKDSLGRYRQAGAFITTGEKWQSAAIHSFQKETIRLAAESLDRHPKKHRDISTITVSVSHKDLDEIRERIHEFHQSILNIKNDNPADCVYQINIQVIPLSSIEDGAA